MRNILALTVVHVLWGLSFLGSRIALQGGLGTWSLLLVRYVIAGITMALLLLFRGEFRVKRQQLIPLIISGIIGVTAYYWLQLMGIQRTSTSGASLILAAIPVLTIASQAAVDRRRLRSFEIASVLMSLCGVGLIVLGSAQEGTESLLGDLFILGAAATWVVYLFVSRRLRKNLSGLQMTGWQSIFALFTIIPFAAAEPTDWAAITPGAWVSAAILGLLCSALCYWLYGSVMDQASPLAIAIFVNLMPLVTILGGIVFLNEVLTLSAIIGGMLILGSIFIVCRCQSNQSP